MASASPTQLLDTLRRQRLLVPSLLAEAEALQAAHPEPRGFAKALVQRGWLTLYQAKLLLAGRSAELLVGPYLILDELGEGGNGRVYKARHQSLGRVVALKVLRQELLADPEVVGRFYREIEVVSHISHPNIVHAYDAGPVDTRLILALEFVDGVDLEKLVNQQGPLPPALAVEYLRQAAIGLQHAHEKGLVHRDLKPSNLLLAKPAAGSSIIKILDMGLARLRQPVRGSRTANLTVVGGASIMQGTPDYMAPEQALDFHETDTRADIYSLGCTLLYLLTGAPPFPGGSLAQKLMAHQQAEPARLAELAQQVSPELVGVLHRMLAKKPGDRFQTPGEVAAALAAVPEAQAMAGAADTVEAPLPGGRTMKALVPSAGLRRRRWALLAILLIGLAGLVLLPLGLLSWNGPAGSATSAAVAVATAPQGPQEPLRVTIAQVSSHRPYAIGAAWPGELYWIDRKYSIASLTPGLQGGILIRCANDDKSVKLAEHLTFVLNQPADVYVCYDARGKSLPAWLTDDQWQTTKEAMHSKGEESASPFRARVRRFPAGKVTLGGNLQPPAAGAASNYLVIVQPAQAGAR